MLHHVLTVLKRRCLLDFHLPVLLGVSGGSDSLCMMHLVHEAGIPVIIAHYNHHLRPEADQEAKKVQQWVEELGLPFVYGERDNADHINEELARQKRYEFLFRVADEENAQAVAVAHNADDQVETLLLHILRGSGLTGLTGMAYYSMPNPWSERIPLVRPLLGIWRSEIDEFIRQRGLIPNVDASNFDIVYSRNRIRRELIPNLETYNPQIKRRLWQMADILSDEEAMIEGVVEEGWNDVFEKFDENLVELRVKEFRFQKINVQRRLARKAIRLLIPSLRDIDFGLIDRFITLANQRKNYQDADLGEGLQFSKYGDRLIVSKGIFDAMAEAPQIAGGITIPVTIPGDITLSPSWHIEIEQTMLTDDDRRNIKSNSDRNQIWLALDTLDVSMAFRPRKDGDIFCPLGMDGQRTKLSDFMINEKIPRSARAKWPLLEIDGEIVWVVGVRAGHGYRVTEDTRRVVRFKLKRNINLE